MLTLSIPERLKTPVFYSKTHHHHYRQDSYAQRSKSAPKQTRSNRSAIFFYRSPNSKTPKRIFFFQIFKNKFDRAVNFQSFFFFDTSMTVSEKMFFQIYFEKFEKNFNCCRSESEEREKKSWIGSEIWNAPYNIYVLCSEHLDRYVGNFFNPLNPRDRQYTETTRGTCSAVALLGSDTFGSPRAFQTSRMSLTRQSIICRVWKGVGASLSFSSPFATVG